MDRVGAEVGADSAFLENRDRRRQCSRPQQQREIARRLHRKAAGDDAAAAEDRLTDDRRADHFVIEHDSEGLADILARCVAKAFGPGSVEAETDHRLAVLKGRLGVDEGVAADHHALAYDVGGRSGAAPPALLRRQNLIARRQLAAPRVFERDGRVDKLKGELAVRPNSALTCSGLSTPGSWTRMRSDPSRWIVGSLVPVSSMRRRMISID